MTWVIMVAAIVVFLGIAWITWRITRNTGLSKAKKTMILTRWTAVLQRTDGHRKVMEGDAVVAILLKELGYTGTMADMLRRADTQLPERQEVWDAHKLRNRLAHEPGMEPTPREVERAMKAFERVIRKFCA